MSVLMMQVGNVSVIVSQRRMHVRMRMRFTESAFVPMLMMPIVEVKMLMRNELVSVRVAVSFARHDCYTKRSSGLRRLCLATPEARGKPPWPQSRR